MKQIDTFHTTGNLAVIMILNVKVKKQKYRHVSPYESNVYDLTTWIEEGSHDHDGSFILDMSSLDFALFEDARDTPGVKKFELEVAVRDFPGFRKLKDQVTYSECLTAILQIL